MAINRHEYVVSLDLQTSQASKQSLAALKSAIDDTGGSLDKLGTTYAQLAQYTKDRTVLERQLGDVISNELKKRDDELGQIEAQKVALLTNAEITDDMRKSQLATLQARERELKREKAHIKARGAEFKLQARIQQMTGKLYDINSKEFKLYSAKIKLQEKFNKLLSKEGAIRKGLTAAGGKVAKGAAIAAGGALALGGAAVASAGAIYDREAALKSLKQPATPADVQEVFLNSGGRADYSTIVASINKLSNKFSGDELRAHALLDIENPGWAETVLRANRIGGTAAEAARILDQIKRNTGATDLSSVMEAASRSAAVTVGKITQTEYMQAHAALQGLGLDDDRIRYIINSIAAKKGSFIDNFNATDFTKYVWRAQQKTLIANAGVGIKALDTGVDVETPEQKDARKTQRMLARFQLERDKWLAEILTKIVDSGLMDKLANIVIDLVNSDLIKKLADFAFKGLELLTELVQYVTGSKLEELGEDFTDFVKKTPFAQWANIGEALGSLAAGNISGAATSAAKALNPFQGAYELVKSLSKKAQGGVVTAPALCGEAGAEMVLPLNNPGRAANIINNYNNTNNFSMSGTQTPLSLSAAISNKRFIKHASAF